MVIHTPPPFEGKNNKILQQREGNLVHFAATNGQTEILKYLLSLPSIKIEPNSVNDFNSIHLNFINLPTVIHQAGDSPFHLAARGGNLEMVKMFLSMSEAVLNEPSTLGRTLLHESCFAESTDVLSYLIEKKASPQIKDTVNFCIFIFYSIGLKFTFEQY